jgi:ribosomal protein S18 acetylase RimI-like enzyme
MNVDPEYRGRGVGSCLWGYTVEHAQTMGTRIKGLHVWAMDGNQQAIRFYRSRPDVVEVGTGNWWIGRNPKREFPATGFEVKFKSQLGPVDPSTTRSSA